MGIKVERAWRFYVAAHAAKSHGRMVVCSFKLVKPLGNLGCGAILHQKLPKLAPNCSRWWKLAHNMRTTCRHNYGQPWGSNFYVLAHFIIFYHAAWYHGHACKISSLEVENLKKSTDNIELRKIGLFEQPWSPQFLFFGQRLETTC